LPQESDGGVLLLAQADRATGKVYEVLNDEVRLQKAAKAIVQ
jgi:hypothetical protein